MAKLRENSLSTQKRLTLYSHCSPKTQRLLAYYSRQTKVITRVLGGWYSDDRKTFVFTDNSEITHEIPMIPNRTQCTPVHLSAPKFVVTELLSSNWYCASEKHHKWAIFISQQQSTHETCRHKDTTSPTLAGSIFRSHIAFTDFATAVLSESDFILAMNDCAGLLFFSVCPSQPRIVRREAANLVRHPLKTKPRNFKHCF